MSLVSAVCFADFIFLPYILPVKPKWSYYHSMGPLAEWWDGSTVYGQDLFCAAWCCLLPARVCTVWPAYQILLYLWLFSLLVIVQYGPLIRFYYICDICSFQVIIQYWPPIRFCCIRVFFSPAWYCTVWTAYQILLYLWNFPPCWLLYSMCRLSDVLFCDVLPLHLR